MLGALRALRSPGPSSSIQLDERSRVAVIGGGPAGSFFSYFLLEMARRVGMELQVDIYEPRDFSTPGPTGCNMCGGIVSESLVQALAAEGINLPSSVVQRGIDSYLLHMDVGSIRIATPLQEKRIAAVHRGAGPRGIKQVKWQSFDKHLLGLAVGKGARWLRARVEAVAWQDGRPQIKVPGAEPQVYDLIAVATGVNASASKIIEGLELRYKPPRTTKTYIAEFCLGQQLVEKYFGSSMHVFLLNIPRLEFAALIPKGDYVTLCLLGHDIDKPLIQSFMDAPEVRQCLPPDWEIPKDFCHCSPRISVQGAVHPFADRMVFVGDCGVSRLYKDGIGAAYRCSKAAAVAAVFEGISAEDFRRRYWPACRTISDDNRLGKLVFFATRQIQNRRYVRAGLLRMLNAEQHQEGRLRRMSSVLWDTFTGSAPYRDVFRRSLHPAFLTRFLGDIVAGFWRKTTPEEPRRTSWKQAS